MSLNNILFRVPVFLVFNLVLFSCSRKDHEDDLALPQAEIKINLPVENAIVRYGETLVIKGTASCIQELHGYEISIRKVGSANLYFQHYHGHGNTISIEENWKNVLTETADMEVIVDVILDHEQHKQTKILKFRAQYQ